MSKQTSLLLFFQKAFVTEATKVVVPSIVLFFFGPYNLTSLGGGGIPHELQKQFGEFIKYIFSGAIVMFVITVVIGLLVGIYVKNKINFVSFLVDSNAVYEVIKICRNGAFSVLFLFTVLVIFVLFLNGSSDSAADFLSRVNAEKKFQLFCVFLFVCMNYFIFMYSIRLLLPSHVREVARRVGYLGRNRLGI